MTIIKYWHISISKLNDKILSGVVNNQIVYIKIKNIEYYSNKNSVKIYIINQEYVCHMDLVDPFWSAIDYSDMLSIHHLPWRELARDEYNCILEAVAFLTNTQRDLTDDLNKIVDMLSEFITNPELESISTEFPFSYIGLQQVSNDSFKIYNCTAWAENEKIIMDKVQELHPMHVINYNIHPYCRCLKIKVQPLTMDYIQNLSYYPRLEMCKKFISCSDNNTFVVDQGIVREFETDFAEWMIKVYLHHQGYYGKTFTWTDMDTCVVDMVPMNIIQYLIRTYTSI